MRMREMIRMVEGRQQTDGAGVRLVRVIGNRDTADFDPFLMLDAFDSRCPEDYIRGFPWHPHRGIETITYLAQGDIVHGDSLGNQGRILDGCCQWMTGGSGILHQEMPQACPRMLGVQLWLNLPAEKKMAMPGYGEITAEMIPRVDEPGARVGVIAGRYKQTDGAFEGRHIKPLFLDVELQPGALWRGELPFGDTAFLFTLEGSLTLGDETDVPAKRAALLGEGDYFTMTAGAEGARVLVLSAPPLKEPVAWGGPIVMNTRQELDQAFRELKEGTFVKHE